MSLFSYIAFPREVDTSCLHSKFDKSKAYTVGEIRGAELEQQFNGNINDLPDDLNVYMGDWSDFHGIHVFDRGSASFDAVFANKHIYSFQATLRLIDEASFSAESHRIYMEDDDPDMNEEEFLSFSHSLIKENRNDVAICRQQLYDIVLCNVKAGEAVEIYSDWVDHRNIFSFGPPKTRIRLEVEDVLTSEQLDLQENTVIEIRRA